MDQIKDNFLKIQKLAEDKKAQVELLYSESEKLNFHIVRFIENKFMIFLLDVEQQKEILNTISNVEQLLSNTTLKSNSGLFIKAKYNFKVCPFKTNQNSQEVFEELLAQEK